VLCNLFSDMVDKLIRYGEFVWDRILRSYGFDYDGNIENISDRSKQFCIVATNGLKLNCSKPLKNIDPHHHPIANFFIMQNNKLIISPYARYHLEQGKYIVLLI